MEVICKILKLKKRSVESRLAEAIRNLADIQFQLQSLESDYVGSFTSNEHTSIGEASLDVCDVQAAQKWRDQLTQRITHLGHIKKELQTEIEQLKADLRILSGKLDMSEAQIKAAEILASREQFAFEDERRLETWRLGKKRQN